jgi:hypothetical protein
LRNIELNGGSSRKCNLWAACIAAVLWAFFVFAMGAAQTHPDWTISTPTAIVGAFVIWSIGRAIRYILNRR